MAYIFGLSVMFQGCKRRLRRSKSKAQSPNGNTGPKPLLYDETHEPPPPYESTEVDTCQRSEKPKALAHFMGPLNSLRPRTPIVDELRVSIVLVNYSSERSDHIVFTFDPSKLKDRGFTSLLKEITRGRETGNPFKFGQTGDVFNASRANISIMTYAIVALGFLEEYVATGALKPPNKSSTSWYQHYLVLYLYAQYYGCQVLADQILNKLKAEWESTQFYESTADINLVRCVSAGNVPGALMICLQRHQHPGREIWTLHERMIDGLVTRKYKSGRPLISGGSKNLDEEDTGEEFYALNRG